MFTMASALTRAGTHFGAHPAMVNQLGERCTWHEHINRVARLAGALRQWGLAPGNRFAILGPNSVNQAELIHAGYWSGSIPVPVNFRLAAPEIVAVLNDSGAAVLFVDPAFIPVAQKIAAAGWPGTIRLLGNSDAFIPTEPAIEKTEPIECAAVSENDQAILLYTGGTTGAGKGVPLTHRNVVSNGLQVGLALGASASDLFLHVAPMFHSADLLGTAVTLSGGAHSYLAAPAPDTFIEAVEALEVTMTMIPPVLLHGLIQASLLSGRNLDALRIFISGGAPVPYELLDKAQSFVPNGTMVQGYGLTETAPILSFMHLQDTRANSGIKSDSVRSAGLPLAGVQMRLIDAQWQDSPTGEPGELAVRGPNVFGGYLNRPDESARALNDGWFRTGDVARIDDGGYLHIVDRTKDVIITGGENVYSAEVEVAIQDHPGVAEVAVVGTPDEKWGEKVVAVIVAKSPDLSEQEIIDHCRERIAGYKIPRACHFVTELPKTALGKVAKGVLREQVG